MKATKNVNRVAMVVATAGIARAVRKAIARAATRAARARKAENNAVERPAALAAVVVANRAVTFRNGAASDARNRIAPRRSR